MDTTILEWAKFLGPIAVSTIIILIRMAREQERSEAFRKQTTLDMAGLNKRIDEVHEDFFRREVFKSEKDGIDSRLGAHDERLRRLENRVFNGATGT